MVRKVPVTTQRIVHEERVEQVPVQVCRMVQETRMVQEPRTVASWKPYTATQSVPRTVVMRVPVDACGTFTAPPTTTYYQSAPPVIVSPPVGGDVTTRRIPTPADSSAVDGSVLRSENSTAPQPIEADKEAEQHLPKDTDPTGQPTIEPAEIPLLEPAGSPDDAVTRPTGNTA